MRKLLPLLLVAALAATALATAAALAGADATAGERPAATLAKKRHRCDPNYKGRCLRPNVSDYDCAGGSGNGPYYVRGPFRVVGPTTTASTATTTASPASPDANGRRPAAPAGSTRP
ncbi:MAG TPA: hypothetical protein VFS59_18575, partial [Gemmatimonadaceae bacterium]|nr:hypothetical protein [Gemmatimonadaceae bacterium]